MIGIHSLQKVIPYYFTANRLLLLNVSPPKYNANTPSIHPAVRPASKLVPRAIPKFKYMGRENSTAANATVDRAKSLPAKREAAYWG